MYVIVVISFTNQTTTAYFTVPGKKGLGFVWDLSKYILKVQLKCNVIIFTLEVLFTDEDVKL